MKRSLFRNFLMILMILQVNGKASKGQNLDSEQTNFFPDAIASKYDYHLIWSDEFEVDGPIDTTKWFHQTKLPAQGSWYNNEIPTGLIILLLRTDF